MRHQSSCLFLIPPPRNLTMYIYYIKTLKWQSFLKSKHVFWEWNPTIHFPFPEWEPLLGEIKSDIATYTGAFLGERGGRGGALKGYRECRKILMEEEEIAPTWLLILVRKFVLVLSQQSHILSILLTKEHTSVYDFNNWYLLSISYKPNTSITCSSDHNSGEQVLSTTVYQREKQRLENE